MSGQVTEPTESVSLRSMLARFSGLPWWAVVLVAVTATAIGFAFDAGAGDKELGAVFATCYVLGCVAAVLAVHQSAVFTAVIQPPLILFVAVPSAYFLFHGGQLGGVKDILINCGYPLIERFPLMFFTSATVLLIGMGRWYFGSSTRHVPKAAPPPSTDTDTPGAAPRWSARRFAKSSRQAADAPTAATGHRRSARRPSRTVPQAEATHTRRSGRTGEPPSRSRHNRPPETDIAASAAAADRRARGVRERPTRARRQGAEPPVPPIDPARQPRRPRPPSSAREPREPREPRRTPPPGRRSYEAPGAPEYYERPRRRDTGEGYPGYEDRPRRTTGGSDSSHHPISRVRYRSTDDENRTEHRTRPRAAHRRDADPWESDI